MSMESYYSEVVSSISEVGSAEWNQVIDEAASISHEVFEFAECNSIYGNKARYFLLRDKNQCLHAVSIALCIDKESELGVEGTMFGRLSERARILKNCLRPALICGLVGHGAPVMVRPGENQALWVERVLDVMEAYAKEQKCSIGFAGLLSEQKYLSAELDRRGYCNACGLPETKIRIDWHDEITYLKSVKKINKKYYKCAKKEINRFRKSGISIQEWDGNNAKAVTSLLKDHHNQRNKIKSEISPESLLDLKIKLEDNCKIYLAIKEEKIIGVAVLLKKGSTARAWKIGIDHMADNNNFTYFNLAYYNILIDAFNLKLKLIWYGQAALNAKIRRGCEVESTKLYYKPRVMIYTPVYLILFAFQRAWYKYKFSSLFNGNNVDV